MQYIVLLATALFFGFAFEQFYGSELEHSPGGVRVFPLLSFTGAALYLIEPHYAAAFIAGLLVLGAWLLDLARRLLAANGRGHGYLMVPVCALLAYTLGAVALTQPMWFTIALAVVAVMLLGSRETLHELTQRVPAEEVLTLGQFLLIVGVALPLLYRAPAIPFTTITPFKVWLAVVAVSTISYVSYLLDRYVFHERGTIVSAILGGMYSSTATTVVFARSARAGGYGRELVSGTIIATAVMYVRLLVITVIFNIPLARALAAPLLILAVIAAGIAVLLWRIVPPSASKRDLPSNPLAIGTAVLFAVLMIFFSQLSTWAAAHLGTAGLLELAALVGFTDVDPFVLGIAQSHALAVSAAAAAVLVASSSNDVLKGAWAVAISRRRESAIVVGGLAAMAALGLVAAWIVLR
ncbi:MAG: DUF4010 domain-containing protein [Candidatus Eremiobacteraeota bacterium]|nr:DUF4010 domain-containing protein [Candidatus Eremiobacteraeota bacterium]